MCRFAFSMTLVAITLIANDSAADPGPASFGSAIAEYDYSSGEVIVSYNGVNNWYVDSQTGSLVGDAPSGLPLSGSALVTDNDFAIGETSLNLLGDITNHNLGPVALPGLLPGDLNLHWNPGLGVPLESVPVSYINVPEPPLFSDIIVFGDSFSDVGNISASTSGLVPSAPYWQGRFSNGPVWVEHLSEGLGLNGSEALLQGGRNYAFGGATTGIPGGNLAREWGMTSQVYVHSYIHNEVRPSSPDDLFVLWGGINDFLSLFSGETNTIRPARNMALNVTLLNALTGAKNFAVPNLFPLGQLPLYKGTDQEQVIDDLVMQYNHNLDAALDWIESNVPEVNVYRVDMFENFQQILSNPGAFGLTNVSESAFDAISGEIVANVDEYLFWDRVHLTRKGHELIGQIALDAIVGSGLNVQAASFSTVKVPEPTTVCLCTTAMLGFIGQIARRRSMT